MSRYREKEGGQRKRLCGSSLFSQIDLHQRQSLRFDDFVQLCDQVFNKNDDDDDEPKQFDRNEMVAIFQILDNDRDGKIDRNDFVVAATSLRRRGGAEDDEEDVDDDDDDDVDCGGEAFWDRPQQHQEYKEKDDERDALAWETFTGSSKRAAVAAKLRSRPHLYDLWRELRSKCPELIDEFEIVVRELACEFDDKVNGLHEQIATLTHAMQRLTDRYESKVRAIEKEAQEQIATLERQLEETSLRENKALSRIDTMSSTLECRDMELEALECKLHEAQCRLLDVQQRCIEAKTLQRQAKTELQLMTEPTLKVRLERVEKLLCTAQLRGNQLEAQLREKKKRGEETRSELVSLKTHLSFLQNKNNELIKMNRELVDGNVVTATATTTRSTTMVATIPTTSTPTTTSAAVPDLVQGMQQCRRRVEPIPSPHPKTTEMRKTLFVRGKAAKFAVIWTCDRLYKEIEYGSGESDDEKVCSRSQTIDGYDRCSLINVSRSRSSSLLEKDNHHHHQHVYKFVLVGDPGVGKSSYLRQVCYNEFSCTTQTTNGFDFEILNVAVGDELVRIQLWDTAGQERFMAITQSYFRKANGIIIVYDTTNLKSISSLEKWLEKAQENCPLTTSIMLIGNKVDLLKCSSDDDDDDDDNDNDLPEMTTTERRRDVTAFAQMHGSLFFETSCRTGINVTASFVEFTRLVLHREEFLAHQAKFSFSDGKENIVQLQLSKEREKKSFCRC